jgi:hypothetical protein
MNSTRRTLHLSVPLALLLSACVQGASHEGTGGTTGGGTGGTTGGGAGTTGAGGSSTGTGGTTGPGPGTGGTTGGGGRTGVGGSSGVGGATGVGGHIVSGDAGTRPDLTGRKALFIVDNPSSLDDGDVQIQQLLEVRGMTVTYGTVTGPASLATGYNLVIGSSGASAADFATVFKDVPVPMILFGNSYFAPMGFMTTASANKGNTDGTVQVTIVDGTTPLADGLPMGANIGVINSVILNTQYTWGNAGGTVIKVASVMGAPTQLVVFGYEKGATMVVGTAAARRVGIGWKANAVKGLFIDAYKLQDAAVSWTAGAP